MSVSSLGTKSLLRALLLVAGASSSLQAVTITQLTTPCPTSQCPWYNFENTPRWSPDGLYVAITSAAVDLNYYLTGGQVDVIAAPGTSDPTPDFSLGQHDLGQPHTMAAMDPTWSRDGQKIACRSLTGLVLLTQNDSSVVQILTGFTGWGKIDWAPHEDKIAVSFAGSLATVDVMSGSRVWVAPGVVGATDPEWSPDGQWIAYSSSEGGDLNVWVVPSSGGTPRQVTTHGGSDSSPTWSPDGQRLAFVSDRSGNKDIWIIGIQGEGVLQVTTDPADDTSPDWSSDGKRIVFVSDRGDAGFGHIWMASDLQTLSVESISWDEMKRRYKE